MRPKYKTVVVSDSHLFSRDTKVKELTTFLKQHPAQTLILNGDILDGWKLTALQKTIREDIQKIEERYVREGTLSWLKEGTKITDVEIDFMELALASAAHGTEVVYLRGNHDDFLDSLVPFIFAKVSVVKEYILESGLKRYFVVHGDIFDVVTTKMKFLSYAGDKGYSFIMWINHHYNRYRTWRGMTYYSFSKRVKSAFKSAVSFISVFEKQLSDVAKEKNCYGIICGHIHSPANKMINGVHYLNSGDWVESLTALVEDWEGNWQIVDYHHWQKTLPPSI